VTIGWCFEDQADSYSEAVLDALAENEAYVPSIWPLEVANVLLVAERRRRLNRAASARLVGLLASLPIIVEEVPLAMAAGEVLAQAREHGLSSSDAAYLSLAIRKGLSLATRDRALEKACRRSGVPLFGENLEHG
jgi:predicted nucleic acid-binding protein